MPGDMASRLWHLVRIAGIHNGDRESKDVQRAVESVERGITSALASRDRETREDMQRIATEVTSSMARGAGFDRHTVHNVAMALAAAWEYATPRALASPATDLAS